MELFDAELKNIMGARYDDGDTPKQMPEMECKPKAAPQPAPQKREAVDVQDVPFPKAAPSFMDRLANAAVWCGICGGISMLMWWFQINDLMALKASYPCILVCVLLAGFGVGKNIKK